MISGNNCRARKAIEITRLHIKENIKLSLLEDAISPTYIHIPVLICHLYKMFYRQLPHVPLR